MDWICIFKLSLKLNFDHMSYHFHNIEENYLILPQKAPLFKLSIVQISLFLDEQHHPICTNIMVLFLWSNFEMLVL